jgi:SAM-dependent methyltransferase
VQRANDAALSVCVPQAAAYGVALDVACGTGRHAVLLRARGWQRRFGFDVSPEMLARAQDYEGVAIADLRQVPMHPTELVLCSLAIGHLPDLDAVLDSLCGLVRHQGDLVLSDLHPRLASGKDGARAFTGADGQTYRLPHSVHTMARVLAGLERRGLTPQLVSEPAPERPLPREPAFPQVPLVWAVRARRLGD